MQHEFALEASQAAHRRELARIEHVEQNANTIVAEMFVRNQEMREMSMRDVSQAQEHAVRSFQDERRRLFEVEEVANKRFSSLEGELEAHRADSMRHQETALGLFIWTKRDRVRMHLP